MEKNLLNAPLTKRNLMSMKLMENGGLKKLMPQVAHLFAPLTKKEKGMKGQQAAEILAEKIIQLLEDGILEKDLIPKAKEMQAEILKTI